MNTKPSRMQSRLQRNAFGLVLLALLSAHLYNLGTQRLYPFLDAPNHLALATIYRTYGEPGNQLDRYYTLKVFPKPNVFHMLLSGSKLFPSVEVGNRAFYLIYAAGFILAVLLAIVTCGGNPWYALLAFLLLYNINVGYGLTGFSIALPTLLLLLCCVMRFAQTLKIRYALALAALLPVVFFMHAMALLFAFLFFATSMLMTARSRNSWRPLFGSVLLCLPSVVLFVVWWMNDSREHSGPGMLSFMTDYYMSSYLPLFWQRAAIMVHDNFRLFGGAAGYAAGAAFSGFLLCFVLLQRSEHHPPDRRPLVCDRPQSRRRQAARIYRLDRQTSGPGL